jgi:hypothetical protein
VKTLLIPILTLAAAVPLTAQDDQTALIAKRAKKLKSSFLAKNAWFTDFDKACAAAKKSKRTMFAYFTRSYAP